jgi:hypothetical protein
MPIALVHEQLGTEAAAYFPPALLDVYLSKRAVGEEVPHIQGIAFKRAAVRQWLRSQRTAQKWTVRYRAMKTERAMNAGTGEIAGDAGCKLFEALR